MTARKPELRSMMLFRPYGSSLMTPGAQLWLTTTWVLACLIAGTEAWVVYSLMQQVGAELWGRLAAAFAVFAAIFLVDASFVLLDVMSSSSTDGGRKKGVLGRWSRIAAAVLVRAGIFALTFLITIPIASIALMDDELGAERDSRWRTQIEAAQDEREAEYKARIDEAQDRLVQIRQRWTDEVNATDTEGVSGRAGVGARARKYERDQRILEDEVRRAQEDLARYRIRLGQMSLEARAEELGVPPEPLTFSARADIMEQIGDRPGVQQKELLVKAYLLMAFAAVVLLKLLAPTAANTYLSEELQEARRRAAGGGYDHLLALGPKGTSPAAMGAVDFRHWYLTELPKLRERWQALHTLKESRASLETYQRSLDQAVAASGMTSEMEERAREKHARAKLDVERLKRKIERHGALLRGVVRREEELATATKWPTTKAHAEMVEKRGQHEEELIALEGQLQLAEQHLSARAADLKRAQERRQLAEKREAALRAGAAKVEETYLCAVEAAGSVPHAIEEEAGALSGRSAERGEADEQAPVPALAQEGASVPAEQGQVAAVGPAEAVSDEADKAAAAAGGGSGEPGSVAAAAGPAKAAPKAPEQAAAPAKSPPAEPADPFPAARPRDPGELPAKPAEPARPAVAAPGAAKPPASAAAAESARPAASAVKPAGPSPRAPSEAPASAVATAPATAVAPPPERRVALPPPPKDPGTQAAATQAAAAPSQEALEAAPKAAATRAPAPAASASSRDKAKSQGTGPARPPPVPRRSAGSRGTRSSGEPSPLELRLSELDTQSKAAKPRSAKRKRGAGIREDDDRTPVPG